MDDDVEATAPEVVRLSVNINRDTSEALRRMAKDRNVSITEVVRRAVAIAAWVEEQNQSGNELTLVDRRGQQHLLVLS